ELWSSSRATLRARGMLVPPGQKPAHWAVTAAMPALSAALAPARSLVSGAFSVASPENSTTPTWSREGSSVSMKAVDATRAASSGAPSIDGETSTTSTMSRGSARPVHAGTSADTQLTCWALDDTGLDTMVAVAAAVSRPRLVPVYVNDTVPSLPVVASS